MRKIEQLVLLLVVFTMSQACEQAPPKTLETEPAEARRLEPPRLSPAQTALRLQALFEERDFARAALLITHPERGPMIDLLVAVDQVLSSNHRLRRAAERRYGGPMAETWSIGEIANNLGPFSKDLEVIDQELGEEGRAIVVLREGRNVPLHRAEFVLEDGKWMYRPEPVPQMFVAEVQRLNEVLAAVADGVTAGKPFEFYLNAFVQNVFPQMRKIVNVRDEPAVALQGETDDAP